MEHLVAYIHNGSNMASNWLRALLTTYLSPFLTPPCPFLFLQYETLATLKINLSKNIALSMSLDWITAQLLLSNFAFTWQLRAFKYLEVLIPLYIIEEMPAHQVCRTFLQSMGSRCVYEK